MSVTKNYFLVNTTIELVDTRFKLLCDEFTLKTQIRQNDENISLGYRTDGILRLVSVSVHNIVHVVTNNTPIKKPTKPSVDFEHGKGKTAFSV